MKTKLIQFLLFLLLPLAVQATHITGGEMTWRCLGNDQYEVTLTVYRDCFNGEPPFDNPAAIGVFTADWTLVTTLFVAPIGNDTLVSTTGGVCIHQTQYIDTVTLPAAANGSYYFVYQRCCRNQQLRNVTDPLTVGLTILAEVQAGALPLCNQGATFTDTIPWQLCIHTPINAVLAASDADGDSLAYRLCTPLNGATQTNPLPQPPNIGPYAGIPLDGAYSLANLLGGIDPLSIDASTGVLAGIPHELGQYAVGVCVDEFRAGVPINTVRRDFHLTVTDCMSGLVEPASGRLRIEPNPATTTVRVTAAAAAEFDRLDVFSAHGLRQPVVRHGNELDIAALPAGLYRVVAVRAGRVASGSFVRL